MEDVPRREDVVSACAKVLEDAWVPETGYCVPNRRTYPHQWLWDSCFHSLAWMACGDDRCLTELDAIFVAQTPSGFVPHIRYLGRPVYRRGPRRDASSLTQPPVYGIVLERLAAAGWDVPPHLIEKALHGLRYLWSHRRTEDGLLVIFHPWESGADDSPRWDSWFGTSRWSRMRFSTMDHYFLRRTHFDADQAARGSRVFAVCPSAFNSIAGYTAGCLARLTGDAVATEIARELPPLVDRLLWNDATGLWDDLPVVGGGGSSATPTLDGVLGALVTADSAKAARALDQVLDAGRFGAPFGARYLPPDDGAYMADAYWRGPAWPQMNYLVWLAARRWGRGDLSAALERWSVCAALSSGFAEYWNPETGAGRGAIPQTWTAVVAAMTDDHAPPPERAGPG